jgi:long-chain acyl-CoA synthetase
LFETFNKSATRYSRRPCLGERHISSIDGTPTLFSFKSYSEVLKCIRDISSGFVKEGLLQSNNPDNLPTFGLFLKNCSAWIIAEQACYAQSAVTVPLYDTLGPEPVQYIINQTGMSAILCSVLELPVLLRVCGSCPHVKTIIVKDARSDVDEFFTELTGAGNSSDAGVAERIRIMTFEELARIGAAHPVEPSPPSPHDLATICYTSGTTGKVSTS